MMLPNLLPLQRESFEKGRRKTAKAEAMLPRRCRRVVASFARNFEFWMAPKTISNHGFYVIMNGIILTTDRRFSRRRAARPSPSSSFLLYSLSKYF